MKKTTRNILLIFALSALLVFPFASCKGNKAESGKPINSSYNDKSDNGNSASELPSSSSQTESSDKADTKTNVSENGFVQSSSMADALFIGDSRTVGMMEYGGLNEANFFCGTGMNVFDIKKNRVSVPAVGKVTLEELLSNKKYGKIYIMLGINELGYEFKSILNKYGDLIRFIREKQPDTSIFIQANLHVSKKRNDSDGYINNKNIDRLNSELSKFANGKNIFYLDVNPLFDDKDGNLSSDKTADNAHLYAKYYKEWGEWICKETVKIKKERQA